MFLDFRLPLLEEEQEFNKIVQKATDTLLHYYKQGISFNEYLKILNDIKHGINLPIGHVPCTFLFAFNKNKIIGRVSIRHTLNEYLFNIGGHVGYEVIPEFRNKGYGTEILKWAIAYCNKKLSIDEILLTCDRTNIPSIKIIEKNGGKLENVFHHNNIEKCKYWIK